MQKIIFSIQTKFIALLLPLSIFLPLTGFSGEIVPLQVFVSVTPQRVLAQRIIGPQAEVNVLVQPGQDPHTYEPSPKQITQLSKTDIYLGIGVPFEHIWLPKIKAINPHMKIIDLSEGLSNEGLLDKTSGQISSTMHEHTQTHTQNHIEHLDHMDHMGHMGHEDPHVWTNPLFMKAMGKKLLNYLIQNYPDNAINYHKNYHIFAKDLTILDQDIRDIISLTHKDISKDTNKHNTCSFMVFHPAWDHFAATYGLTQIAIEHEEKSPGAKRIASLINLAKKQHITVIFVQPQFDTKTAQVLANAIGGKVEILDPLAENYFDNLKQVAKKIARACTP